MIRWAFNSLVAMMAVLYVTACGSNSNEKDSDAGTTSDQTSVTTSTERTHTITATSGEGGSVTPSSLEVASNGTAEFSLVPDEGHSVGVITGCIGDLRQSTYVIESVNSNCSFHVNFQPAVYDIKALVDPGGTVEPMSKAVDHGASITLTITPQAGFLIYDVVGCDGQLVGNEYTTGAATRDCYVEVSFSAVSPYDVSVQKRHQSATVSWKGVTGTDSYNLYYATEAGVTPDNYDSLAGGTLMQNVTSPMHLSSLTNGTYYYAIITAVDGSLESEPSVEVKFVPPGLNDTGLMACSDESGNYFNCPAPAFPGQDAEFGRDILAEYGLLHKVGGGDLGFDFTKLGSDGAALAIQNIEWWPEGSEAEGMRWSCVLDNVTGLIWEVKDDQEFTLRDYRSNYTWFDSTLQGVSQGLEDSGTCHQSACDTQGYVTAVNAAALCGYSDWRMPTEHELLSLAHFSPTAPSLDRHYFPNTRATSYWTGQPSNEADNKARYFNFYNTTSDSSSQWIERPVRLVREAN